MNRAEFERIKARQRHETETAWHTYHTASSTAEGSADRDLAALIAELERHGLPLADNMNTHECMTCTVRMPVCAHTHVMRNDRCPPWCAVCGTLGTQRPTRYVRCQRCRLSDETIR